MAVFGLFAFLERRRDRAGLPTLVTPTLFGKRAFTGGLLTGMAMFGSLMGMSIVFTLFVQYGLGYSPLKAGLAGVAQAIGMVIGFIAAQPLNQRLGRTLMHIGLGVTLAGYVGFVLTLSWPGDGVGHLGDVAGVAGDGPRARADDGAVLRPGARRRRRPGVRLGLRCADLGAAAGRGVRDRGARHGVLPRARRLVGRDPDRGLPRRRLGVDVGRRGDGRRSPSRSRSCCRRRPARTPRSLVEP